MTALIDTYRTLSSVGEASYTESRSRFLAFAHHVADEQAAKDIVVMYRRKYYDARHVCYAYALKPDGSETRQNDDGEPSGTAGRPICGVLRSQCVTYALIVVVRYFGGIKLGTSRLAQAYKVAAAAAIEAASVEERLVETTLRVSVPYADADVAMRYVRDSAANITARDYTATDCQLTIAVRLSEATHLRDRLSKIFSLRFLDDGEASV